jgi:riboflavin synthase
VGEDGFEIMLVPHTLEVTTLGQLKVGAAVNVEVDVLSRYVARQLDAAGITAARGDASLMDTLRKGGFVKASSP